LGPKKAQIHPGSGIHRKGYLKKDILVPEEMLIKSSARETPSSTL
jgi:hypothetical protein